MTQSLCDLMYSYATLWLYWKPLNLNLLRLLRNSSSFSSSLHKMTLRRSLLFPSAFFLRQADQVSWGVFFFFCILSESLAELSMKVTSSIASAARGTCSISALPWWTRGSRLASSRKPAFTERGLIRGGRRHTSTHKSITHPLCHTSHSHTHTNAHLSAHPQTVSSENTQRCTLFLSGLCERLREWVNEAWVVTLIQ